jgi:sugar lactone lactonase YvrE
MTFPLLARATAFIVASNIACCTTIPAFEVSHIAGLTAESPSGAFAQASFYVSGIAYAKDGSIWLATNSTILRVDNSGLLTTVAGTPGRSGFADGKGSEAVFNEAAGLALTPSGMLAVADTFNNCVRLVDTFGNVTTVRDRSGTPVWADHPYSVGVDQSGNIFIPSAYHVVKVSAAGDVSVFAGFPGQAGTADGQGAAARLGQLGDLTCDTSGNVYVSEIYQYTIRKITPDGTVTTLAGTPLKSGHADGPGSSARFKNPYQLAADSATATLYVADLNSECIRKIDSVGTVTTLAGSSDLNGYVNSTGSAARFNFIDAMNIDNAGNVVVSDSSTVRRITPTGSVSTIAGTYQPSTVFTHDGTGSAARFANADGIAIDAAGNLFIADGGGIIRKVTPDGVTSTVAGKFGLGHDDGPALSASFYSPCDLAFTPQGDLVIADTLNHTIRKLSSAGNVTTIAGSAGARGSTDGVGAAARFNVPSGLTVDTAGRIFIADSGNQVIRKLDLDGSVSTFAGKAGTGGFEDGPKAGALFNHPARLAFGPDGSLYVADNGNHRIRKIATDGNVSTVGDYLQSGARGIAVDANGYIYCADSDLYRDDTSASIGSAYSIAVVSRDGMMTHPIGTLGISGNSDGIGSEACVGGIAGVAVDAAGVVYFTDNQAVRKAQPIPVPAISTQPKAPKVQPGAKVRLVVQSTGTRLNYQWLRNGTPIAGQTSSTIEFAASQADDGAAYSVVVSDPSGQAVSNATVLSVSASNPVSGRLINIATRAYCGAGDEVAIGGFVVGGSAPRKILIRAVGPTLKSLGLPASEVLADPVIEIHDASHGNKIVAQNDDWTDNYNAGEVTSTAAAVGASALAPDDLKSSAVLMSFLPGVYTFIVSPKTGGPGVALLEAYDAEPNSPDRCFINIATRAKSVTGNGVTIGGFVIGGGTPMRVLIRAIGPTLSTLGLPPLSVLQNPAVELHDASNGNIVIYRNDDYGSNGNAAEIVATAARIGATAIANSDTTSSALLVTLPAGAYSFLANGAASTGGIVLVEVYDAD